MISLVLHVNFSRPCFLELVLGIMNVFFWESVKSHVIMATTPHIIGLYFESPSELNMYSFSDYWDLESNLVTSSTPSEKDRKKRSNVNGKESKSVIVLTVLVVAMEHGAHVVLRICDVDQDAVVGAANVVVARWNDVPSVARNLGRLVSVVWADPALQLSLTWDYAREKKKYYFNQRLPIIRA